jgi:Urocanase Rossmann-like domain
MPLEPLSPAAFAFIAQVENAFGGLMRCAARQNESGHNGPGLGGQLLYAGHLDESGRAFASAAVIAGAAALAACADPATAKQAMRLGQVDFLVNSLDEALRILKNQVRKRETAAVCVSLAAAVMEAEMRERGVVPDLSFSQDFRGARLQGQDSPDARARGDGLRAEEEKTWLTWRAAASPALCLPKLNALALDVLAPEAIAARRWLERAPRVLGRLAQNTGTLHTTQPLADAILARFRDAVTSGEIPAAVEITPGPWGILPAQSLSPTVP